MLKVLQVINSLSSGGAEVFVAQLASELSSSCEIMLLTYAGELDEKGVSLKEYLQAKGVQYVSLNANTTFKKLVVPINIASVIRKWKPDIVHVHLDRSEQFVFLSSLVTRHKFKAIRTKHDERLYPEIMLNRFMNGFYAKNIACSDSAYLPLKTMGLADNSIVVKNGIELGLIREFDSDEKSNMRTKIGVPDSKIMCLNIGSMQLEETGFTKAQDIIISALANGGLADKCHIVFLGGGTGMEVLKQQSANLGVENSVSFEGVVANVMDYVACADIMIMPSRWEGLPIAAIEVACAGLPMILSNIESFDEFESKSVLRCEVNSVDSLVSTIEEALPRLGELKIEAMEASAEYKNRFSIENVAMKHIELYNSV